MSLRLLRASVARISRGLTSPSIMVAFDSVASPATTLGRRERKSFVARAVMQLAAGSKTDGAIAVELQLILPTRRMVRERSGPRSGIRAMYFVLTLAAIQAVWRDALIRTASRSTSSRGAAATWRPPPQCA